MANRGAKSSTVSAKPEVQFDKIPPSSLAEQGENGFITEADRISSLVPSASWRQTNACKSQLSANSARSTPWRASHPKDLSMPSRRRSSPHRLSKFAVDCGIRANMTIADTHRLLSQVSTLTCFDPEDKSTLPWLETPLRGGWCAYADSCSKQFTTRFTQSVLEILSGLGIVVAVLQLAIEPTCEMARELLWLRFLKGLSFVASVTYLFLAMGEMYALRTRRPLMSLVDYCVESWRHNSKAQRNLHMMASFLNEEDIHPEDKPKIDWLVLDYLVFVSLVAEFVHLFETPVGMPTIAQWVSMLQVLRVWRWIAPLRPRNSDFLTQVMYLFMSVFLFTHTCACLFALVALFETHKVWDTWADTELLASPRSCNGFYWSMFYFASYTVTSIGHGDIVPVSKTERAVNAFVMIFSQMYVAKAFANLTFLISTRNYWEAQRQHRVTQTTGALLTMGAPNALHKRVLVYQDFVWEVRKERRAQECLKDLSDVLRDELQTVKYHELVLQARFLALMSVTSLRHIVRSLLDFAYLPSDFIVRRGDEGSDVYFMREGAAGVFVDQQPPRWTDEEVRILCHGDYFGEVGMLTKQKRTAWIMSRTFSVCSMLPKRAVDEIVVAEPSCVVLLAKSMQEALNLSPGIKWEEVSRRLSNTFGDLRNMLAYVNSKDEETTAAQVVTWSRYQYLMSRIQVAVLDQKLLWIDVDVLVAGAVDFKSFVHVAYAGRLDEEVEALETEGELESTSCYASFSPRTACSFAPLSLHSPHGPRRSISGKKSMVPSHPNHLGVPNHDAHRVEEKLDRILAKLAAKVGALEKARDSDDKSDCDGDGGVWNHVTDTQAPIVN